MNTMHNKINTIHRNQLGTGKYVNASEKNETRNEITLEKNEDDREDKKKNVIQDWGRYNCIYLPLTDQQQGSQNSW